MLRHQDTYKNSAQNDLATAQFLLEQYLTLENTAEEVASIRTLNQTFNVYGESLHKAEQLISQGLGVEDIDNAIMVNDEPALNALAVLSNELYKVVTVQAGTVNRTLHDMSVKGVLFIAISLTLIIVFVILSLLLIYSRIIRPISHLTDAMTELTQDNMDICLEEISHENEFGEMARALDFFRENIIERKKAETELITSERKYRALLENSSDGMVIADKEGKIETVNQQLLRMTGYTESDLIGQGIEVLVPNRLKPKHLMLREDYSLQPRSRLMGAHNDIFLLCKNGRELPVEISLNPLITGENLSVSATLRDISERKILDEQLTYQAKHDSLTGLINRTEFERRSEQLISAAQKYNSVHTLCYMDLDQFKAVNDTCGHAAGDELLRQISVTIQGAIRKRDTLARLGGDEFGLLLEHCTIEQANRAATQIMDAIHDYKFLWEKHSFKVGMSIGLAPITESTPNLTELLKEADSACYMAKELGRDRIHIYHQDDEFLAKRSGEMQWIPRINKALEQNKFCLYAQAIEPIGPSTDEHYELLIRMLDETNQIIPPGSFLPAAERYNLISKIDCWVVKQAFETLVNNTKFFDRIQFCSINISGQSLTNPDVLDFIIEQLDKPGINASKICFEITETAAIANLNHAIKFISTLQGLECQFALDDFGSGLSSFAYLKNLPVNYLKIDGLFVKDIAIDPIDHAMVKSINEVGQVMGMKTIAEFVEDDEIRRMLGEIGVDFAQGYGVGKPMPFEEVIAKT